jgi:hypothetical protein
MYASLLHIRATCPAYILRDLIIRIIFGEEYRSLSFSVCSLLDSLATSHLLGPNIPLNTLNLRSSLNVSDPVSHPFKTGGKMIVLYLLIFIFLNNKLNDKTFCTE